MSVAPDNPAVAEHDALPSPAGTATRAATDVALVATFAAFTAVCAILPAIPMPGGVPITLQTFAVVLAGLVLGPVRGGLAVLLYLAVGFAGLPVFAEGRSGLSVLSGPSVGYLLSFPLAAALAGFLGTRALRVRGSLTRPAASSPAPLRVRLHRALPYLALVGAGLASTMLVVHPLGIAGLVARLDMTPLEAFLVVDLKFWPGDVVKNLASAAVALAVLRAFPDLRRTRR